MADQDRVRDETVQEPVDGQVIEPHVTIGWDHRGMLCFNLHLEMPWIAVAAELRRMMEIADRNVTFNKPKERLVLPARGNVPRNNGGAH